jgi:hypothetical protein
VLWHPASTGLREPERICDSVWGEWHHLPASLSLSLSLSLRSRSVAIVADSVRKAMGLQYHFPGIMAGFDLVTHSAKAPKKEALRVAGGRAGRQLFVRGTPCAVRSRPVPHPHTL